MADPAGVVEKISSIVDGWVADSDFPAEYAEWVDGRLAVRMAQSSRDATTVWLTIGSRTVLVEAYLLPAPRLRVADVHRQLLRRNHRARFARFAIDADGDIFLQARLAVEWLDADSLQSLFAEISELIDVSFRPLLGLGFGAPDGREKLL